MFRPRTYTLFAVIAAALFFAVLVPGAPLNQFASALLTDSYITPTYLKQKYTNDEPVRVLIVPGHDDIYAGAEYGGLREADITVELGSALHEHLAADSAFEPILTRTKDGYTKNFSNYYQQNTSAITRFMNTLRERMHNLFASGDVERRREVYHNTAPSSVAHRLYGINKWANDIGADIVIHIHFNDHNRRREPYKRYAGFSTYIPERQLPNYESSYAIARSLVGTLSEYFPISDLPGEASGIVEDQDLIAIGANGSLMPAVAFMEYSYIYESHIKSAAVRQLAVQEFAYQTYRGLMRFFDEDIAQAFAPTATLPYTWHRQLDAGVKYSPDVFALQLALASNGWYPPRGFTGSECPITGNYGNCTVAAVRAFQRAAGLASVGRIGPQTLTELNERYSRAYTLK